MIAQSERAGSGAAPESNFATWRLCEFYLANWSRFASSLNQRAAAGPRGRSFSEVMSGNQRSKGEPPSSDPPSQVESLTQLDALVGRHVMGCAPRVYWEDSYTQWRFDTLPEAFEAMRDPFFSALTPEGSRPRSSLRGDPGVSALLDPSRHRAERGRASQLRTRAAGALAFARPLVGRVCRAFGCDAVTAPLAICLAALRSRGIWVELEVVRGEPRKRSAVSAK